MDEKLQEKLEEISMMIIANSGEARSLAAAEELMEKASASMQTAHESHRELLQLDASGQVERVSILLCHAQDHLMGSALATDLIKEMICLYKDRK